MNTQVFARRGQIFREPFPLQGHLHLQLFGSHVVFNTLGSNSYNDHLTNTKVTEFIDTYRETNDPEISSIDLHRCREITTGILDDLRGTSFNFP